MPHKIKTTIKSIATKSFTVFGKRIALYWVALVVGIACFGAVGLAVAHAYTQNRAANHPQAGSAAASSSASSAAAKAKSSDHKVSSVTPAATAISVEAATAISAEALTTSTTIGPVAITQPASVITPEQYGAVGDGTHDDTTALQSAVTAASGKSPVWLSAGKTYLANKTIRVSSDTTIQGAGPTAVLKFTWSDLSGPSSGGNPYLGNKDFNTGNSNINFTNFVVIGAGSGQPSGPSALYPNGLVAGVRLRKTTNFSFLHLEIKNVPGISLTYQGGQNGTVEYNNIHNSGRDGITGFWQEGGLRNVTVAYNNVSEVGDDGIAINGLLAEPNPANTSELPTDIRIFNNTITGWGSNVNGRTMGRGIFLSGVNGIVAQNNSIKNTASAGILVSGCNEHLCSNGSNDPATGQRWRSQNVKILDNSITNAGQLSIGSTVADIVGAQSTDGISFVRTDNSLASGNLIANSLGQAVNSNDCSNCTLQ